MLVLLLFFLIVLCILFYYLFKSFTSPSLVLTGVFIIGDIFAILGNMNWQVEINPLVLVVILGAIVIMGVGEWVGRHLIFCCSTKNYISISEDTKPIKINSWIIYSLFIFLIVGCCFYIREQINLANTVSYGTTSLLKRIRYVFHNNLVENSPLIKVFLELLKAIAFVFSFIFLFNTIVVYKKLKIKNLKYLLPLVPFVVSEIFSAARSGFIMLFAFLVVLSVILIQKRKKIRISRLICCLGIIIILFLIVFSVLGTFTEKVTESNYMEQIYIYAGSSIVALSEYLTKNMELGQSTESFTGIINLFNSIFYNDEAISYSLEYTYFVNGSATNIYTAFRSYLHDFGFIGLFIIQFFTGLIFGHWNKKITNKGVINPLSSVLYSYYFYQIILILFTPNLTSSLLTVGRIAALVFIIIAYKVILCNYNSFYRRPCYKDAAYQKNGLNCLAKF